jgi:hypothetical protein
MNDYVKSTSYVNGMIKPEIWSCESEWVIYEAITQLHLPN